MQGHCEQLASGLFITHDHFQDADTCRWVARYELEIHHRDVVDIPLSDRCYDLDFATEAEAVDRNRTLAHNWLLTNGFLEKTF